MKKIIRYLNIHFYASFVAMAVIFVLSLLKIISPAEDENRVIGVVAERYAIVVTILVIPMTLKLYGDRLKKIVADSNKTKVGATYKTMGLLRLYIINIVTLGNIVLFAFSRNSNFMWLAVILLLVYFFCKPSLAELKSICTPEETKDIK